MLSCRVKNCQPYSHPFLLPLGRRPPAAWEFQGIEARARAWPRIHTRLLVSSGARRNPTAPDSSDGIRRQRDRRSAGGF